LNTATTRDPQLTFFEALPDDPNIGFLIAQLQDGEWALASEIIARVFGQTGVKWSDKKIRDLAAAAAPQIISGQLGYRLTRCATVEETSHCVNWLTSQGGKMIARAEAIRRFTHKQIG